jgi:hypothetical protein
MILCQPVSPGEGFLEFDICKKKLNRLMKLKRKFLKSYRNENFIYFDLDTHYWSSKKLPYVENIDYEMLKNNIRNTLSDKEIVVIDGVCTLSILEKLSLNPTISIYIKKFGDSDYWFDGREFKYDLDLEEVLEEKREIFRKGMGLKEFDPNSDVKSVTDTDISYDIIRYHFKHKPDKNADIIYERYQ